MKIENPANAVERGVLWVFEHRYPFGALMGVALIIAYKLNSNGLPFAVLASFVGGAVFTYYYTIAMERKRRPKFRFEPLPVQGNDVAGRSPMMTLRVKVWNEEPKWWHNRDAAFECFARLSVYKPDLYGNEFHVIKENICTRWAGTPQPVPLGGQFQGSCVMAGAEKTSCVTIGNLQLADPLRYDLQDQDPEQRKDIYAGEWADLDIVCRFIDEKRCFVWNNQYYLPSYLSQILRYQKEVIYLEFGEYLLRLRLFSSTAATQERAFWLTNTRHGFCLRGPVEIPISVLSNERVGREKDHRLGVALQAKDTSLMMGLLSEPSFLERPFGSNWKPLIFYSLFGNWQMVDLILRHGASVDATDDCGYTPLMFAASHGHWRVVNLLRSYGARINSQGHDGKTALMLAAAKGDMETVEKLIALGADVNLVDGTGHRASDYALRCPKLRDYLRSRETS
jgi:hypothetical protein